MGALEVVASAVVDMPSDRLWEVMTDTSRYAEWVVATDAVTRTDGPARLGSTYAEVNPIAGPWKARTEWTVVEFDPHRRQVHRTEDIPLARSVLAIMEVARVGGASRVSITLRSAPAGALGRALFAVLKRKTSRDNERSVRNLVEMALTERARGDSNA